MLRFGKALVLLFLFSALYIREEYKIPFYYTPTSVFLPNNKSALRNADFVLGAITELLKAGSVVQCPCLVRQ